MLKNAMSLVSHPAKFNSLIEIWLLKNQTKASLLVSVCSYSYLSCINPCFPQAGHLEWMVDELPQESWLNTHFWRWILPQLYKKYPSMEMALNFACSVAPMVQLNKDGATASAAADLTLLVKTDTGPLPVACIGMVSKGNCGLLRCIGVKEYY